MKLQGSFLLLSPIPALVHAGCLSDDPTFEYVRGIPSCSYGRFKGALKTEIAIRVAAGAECKKLKFEIRDLFDGGDPIASLREACGEAIEESRSNTLGSFEDVFDDERLVKEFYDGNTYINQEVQQKRPTAYTGKEESNRIGTFHKTVAKNGIVEWPTEYVENFNNCEMNTAMCCWVTDRKINKDDNNGDCKSPYPRGSGPEDSNCVDADPADNTDLCYVDHARSPQANHVEGGFSIFDGESEGPVHCHGFAWSDDPLAASNRFMGNTLFYVSLQDHLRNRGYVRNVPGAPMCGCLEQMPTVSRSDCTKTSAKDTFDFSYDRADSTFDATIVSTKVNFKDCGSLEDHYRELVDEGEVQHEDRFSKVIVGDNNCGAEIDEFLDGQGIERIV